MPHKKLARRFDPRIGVSEVILETECQYVGHELRDCLLGSINELRETLAKRHAKLVTSEANLQMFLSQLPDRERLAIRCMLARDFFHIAALYEKFFGLSRELKDATGPVRPMPEELTKEDEPAAVIPFAEWLFEPSSTRHQ